MPRMMCKHCGDRMAQAGKRGLCHVCFADKEIRVQYPVDPKCGHRGDYHEPTMEELERTIAEQLPTMPKGHESGDGELTSAEKRMIARKKQK